MVYITGDTHGDLSRFETAAAKKLKKGDTLIVLGDFGFVWDGSAAEKKRLQKLGKKIYTVAFLDGRHENYDLLAAYPAGEWNGGRVQTLVGNVVHLLRGEIYTIEGKTFLAFGGGESPDHDFRMHAGTFFEQEMPTAADMENATAHLQAVGNTVDYILTHEPSGKANGYFSLGTPTSGINLLFNPLEETVHFTRWYFGCLHLDRAMSSRHRAVFENIVPVEELWKEQNGKHFRTKKK